jgi:uncharacterized protein YecE (DUF72 family)
MLDVGKVLVGTASWTDRTLVESGWYPPEVKTPEQRLAYYASQFRLVEVDSTYYAMPAERTASLWAQRTPAGFTFDVKAFSLLTHHPTKPSALPKDLRPQQDEETKQKNLYLRDTDPAIVDAIWERFLSALQPLVHAHKFGAILLQFPQWFPISRGNKQYILDSRDRSAPLRICVEFRNRTWMSDDNREETLEFLSSHDIPYVCVDMPQGYPDSVPPVLAATADLAVTRFHGHSPMWTNVCSAPTASAISCCACATIPRDIRRSSRPLSVIRSAAKMCAPSTSMTRGSAHRPCLCPGGVNASPPRSQ